MIKLIASDMDGTLLNSNHKISKGNAEAIKKAEEMGVKFAISTGRIYDDVKPLLEECDLRCQCIALNGAEYLNEEGKVLESVYIDRKKALEIIELMKKEKIVAEIHTNYGLYSVNTKEDTLIQTAYRIRVFDPEISFEDAIELAKTHPHFVNVTFVHDIDKFLDSDIKIGKFVSFQGDEETTKEIKKKFESLGGLATASTFTKNVEVNNQDAQKGLILAKVAEKMGIKREEVMVIGDSFNDYSMFTEFTESFAMENAVTEIKDAAKYITDTNDNDGVAKAIYKVLNLK